MAKKYSTLIRRNARRSVSKRFRQWGRLLISKEVAQFLSELEDLPVSDEQTGKDDSRVESQH